jgi:hypothetical protein
MVSQYLHINTLIKQIGERLPLYVFCAYFDIEPPYNAAVPSRAVFCRAIDAALRRLACTCGSEMVQQQHHDRACPYDLLLNNSRPSVFALRYNSAFGSRNGWLTVNFSLIGDHVQLLPFIILALSEIAIRSKDSESFKLRLIEVRTFPNDERIYDGKNRTLNLEPVNPFPYVNLGRDESASKITVQFTYPTNLAYSGSSSVIPEFSILIGCLWRRLTDFLPDIIPIDDVPDLKKALENVHLVQMKLKWRKTPQSGRGGPGKTGGIVGHAVYAGKFEPFMPLWRLGEWIGMDDGSWMNAGLISIEMNDRS